LFSIVISFPQRNLKLPNHAGPTPQKTRTYQSNCRFGPVWGNFLKTCITPRAQLKGSMRTTDIGGKRYLTFKINIHRTEIILKYVKFHHVTGK